MKSLVLGGAGFVGSHVADALTDAGHEVTVFDCVESPYLRSEQKMVSGDVGDLDAVVSAVAGHDFVYNFAGLADIDESRTRPIETARFNVLGNVNALEAARLAHAKRYIYASSIYVSSAAGSFYRVSKQASELYIEEYQREFGLDYTILRYGTLFGRRANDFNSVRRYLRQALQERRVVAYGTGDELREYIHVADAAKLSVEILADEYVNEQIVLTGQQHLKFADLLTLVKEIVGDDVEIDLSPPNSHDEALSSAAHYAVTPYTFRPRIAKKLVSNYFTDVGQGLLDCLQEIHEQEHETLTPGAG